MFVGSQSKRLLALTKELNLELFPSICCTFLKIEIDSLYRINESQPRSNKGRFIIDRLSPKCVVISHSPELSLSHKKKHTPPLISTPGKHSKALGKSCITRMRESESISFLNSSNPRPPLNHRDGTIIHRKRGFNF